VEGKKGRIRRVGCWLAFPITLKEFSTDYAPIIQAVAALLALGSLLQVWWQIRKGNAWNRIAAAFGLLDVDRFDELEKAVIQQ